MMHGPFTWKSLLFILLAAQPSALFGQSARPGPAARPTAPPVTRYPDPREQRAAREQAVATVGATGRDFVETYGEDAVAAISACSQPVALRLVEFHAAGVLGKLPRPRGLLRLIGEPQHGDEVASWAMAHAGELMDLDYFDAYLIDPLPYALALQKLDGGAAEVCDRRRRWQDRETQAARASQDLRLYGLGGGVAAVFLLLGWWYRQRRAWDPPVV